MLESNQPCPANQRKAKNQSIYHKPTGKNARNQTHKYVNLVSYLKHLTHKN